MTIQNVIKSRKSVREYDSTYEISNKKIEELLALSSSAPSGHNLQSWRIAVIKNKEIRKKIQAVSHNQPQITSASALLVFYADTQSTQLTEEIYRQDLEEGFLTPEIFTLKLSSSHDYHSQLTQEHLAENAVIDTSLFAMQFMLVAKEKGYDTVPMRGFSQSKLREIIDVPDGYNPLLLMAIGKSSQDAFQTSRLPVSKFTKFFD